jgi:hypothetical protein
MHRGFSREDEYERRNDDMRSKTILSRRKKYITSREGKGEPTNKGEHSVKTMPVTAIESLLCNFPLTINAWVKLHEVMLMIDIGILLHDNLFICKSEILYSIVIACLTR